MYFADKEGGAVARNRLWTLYSTGKLLVHPHSDVELERMKVLTQTYADIPMDFADASIVAAAERLGFNRIFTLDSHFYAYRINETASFDVMP